MGLEQQLGDMLADGKITDTDAEEVRTFTEFLAVAGSPANVGGNPRERLLAAGREDLLDWALGHPAPDVEPPES